MTDITLKPEGAALVYDPETGIELMIPRGDGDEDQPVPFGVVLLSALAIRIHKEPEFCEAQLAWLEAYDSKDSE